MNLIWLPKQLKQGGANIVTLEKVDQNTIRSDTLDQVIIAEKSGMYYVFGKAVEIKGRVITVMRFYPNIQSRKPKYFCYIQVILKKEHSC
ncbi:hypothetical protein [Gilliamella sp. Occ3-1]|uniref:hypothetical protein n=1 Tax=unclassified Gilliamella TaxID=2685620 RepID=UPI00080D9DCA|nr:hypothetical protein [Gilliamella apicola]OCG70891.1 hypothetical protein A9G43_06500 [Gilliamella apicola]